MTKAMHNYFHMIVATEMASVDMDATTKLKGSRARQECVQTANPKTVIVV